MKSDWQMVTLEQAMEAIIDYRGKTPKKTDFGIPLITAKIVKKGALIAPSEFIAAEDYDAWMVRGLPKEGDVVITTEAPLGEVAQLGPEKVALAQRIVTLRGKKNYLNNDFLLYLLQSKDIQHKLNARASGSTVKGIKQKELRKVELFVPSYTEQLEIAKHLKSIDRKIELNQQINQTLEAMAQALFKSWFVDFDPVKAKIAAREAWIDRHGSLPEPDSLFAATYQDELNLAAMEAISGKNAEALAKLANSDPERYAELKATAAVFPDALVDSELGEIPAGWEVKQFDNFALIKRGGSPRPIKDFIVPDGLPWLKIADATAQENPFIFSTRECIREEGLKKTVLLKKGSLILSNSATPGLPRILMIDACIHDGWLHFPEYNHFTKEYLYLLFLKLRKEIVSKGSGSVFTNLKTDILKTQLVIAPDLGIIEKFQKLMKSTFEIIELNSRQTIELSNLRDTLLPKLLSGELSVEGIELDDE